MPKDRTLNPATAQLKADKARALKKGKAAVQQQRQQRLAQRNPDRLQRQIDELKQLEAAGGLRPKDKQQLEQLERDVKAVRKAREVVGVKDEGRRDRGPGGSEGRGERGGRGGSRGGRGGQMLGKRRRDDDNDQEGSQSEETDEEVRRIPMPKDTPPPIPRRGRRGRGNPNEIPVGDGPHGLPQKPVEEAKTVYSSAPQVRDLRKEAVSAFVPAAVQRKLGAVKGQGRLLEPEEADRLEEEGYSAKNTKKDLEKGALRDAEKVVNAATDEARHRLAAEAAEDDGDVDLEEEQRRFEQELSRIETEELKDQAMHDAEEVVEAAEEEARLKLMNRAVQDDPSVDIQVEGKRFDRELRKVEMEEVEDEDM